MKESLEGVWQFEPLEWQCLQGDGLLARSTDHLPPPGTMMIPQNWQLAGLENFHGRIKFWRHFAGPVPDAAERVFLMFEGVDYRCQVFLNQTAVGVHEGYFQAFEWEVTDVMRSDNVLEVIVDCPKEDPETVWPDHKILLKGVFNHHDARPGGWSVSHGQDQPTGGIWGAVHVQTRPATFVERVQVETTLLESDHAWVRASIGINARERGQGMVGLVWDNEEYAQSVMWTSGHGTYDICFLVKDPQLWWTWDLGQPHLYRVQAFVRGEGVHHHVTTHVGIRDIRYESSTGIWYLNGRRLFLRGTNVIPTQWLSAYTDGDILRDVTLMQEAHINAVRVHAHVNRQAFYDVCDRLGVLVWQDFALQWTYQETSAVVSSAARQITEMVTQLFNHPSIFTWCCHNEPSGNAESMDKVLAQVVQGLDSTRHVHTQSGFSEHPYWGWYLDDYRAFRDAPMGPLVTEFGAQALPNMPVMKTLLCDESLDFSVMAYHNFQWDETVNVARVDVTGRVADVVLRSQQYQADLLKFTIEQYRHARYVKVGAIFQFMFMDCWPSVSWSVVDVNREPKRGYFALQQAYQPILPMARLNRQRWMPGRELVIPVEVINDTHRGWQDAEIVIGIRGIEVQWEARKPVAIPADGISPIVDFHFPIVKTTPSQRLQIDVAIQNGHGVRLGANEYVVEIGMAAPAGVSDGPRAALNG